MNKKNPQIAFFGTSSFAAAILSDLIEKQFELAMVVTQPDRPAGRGQELAAAPVKTVAGRNSIPLMQFASLGRQAEEAIGNAKFELAIVAAYGLIIPQKILGLKPARFINVHPSLLPKYRGPSPIQYALQAGEQATGTTIMLMDKGMDSGPILGQKQVDIGPTENYDQLEEKLAVASNEILASTLSAYLQGKIIPHPQDQAQATYTKLIKKSAGLVDWNNDAEMIYNMHRAFFRWPKIFSYFTDGKTTKKITFDLISIHNGQKIKPGLVELQNGKVLVGTKTWPIELEKVTMEGKNTIEARAFVNGKPNFIKAKLHQKNQIQN